MYYFLNIINNYILIAIASSVNYNRALPMLIIKEI